MQNKKICVIGLGYIGLPTATILANHGFNVVGVDVVESVVNSVNAGKTHIVEPKLHEYVEKVVNNGKLSASLVPEKSDIFIIAVPTPFKENHEPDLTYINQAVDSIAPLIKDGNCIILESTSPIGTTQKIEKKLTSKGVDSRNIHIGYCPERVLPGNIMHELIENDRIVGGTTESSTSKIVDFYNSFVNGSVYGTSSEVAEMVKLIENSYRDVNIAFANELSIICDDMNIDVNETIDLANKHPRVDILNPGVGVGGHCIAVDPWFIINANKKNTKIIKVAREINLFKTEWVLQKIEREIATFTKKNNKSPLVACLGISYKPNIDDLRESPALLIVEKLIDMNHDIIVVEPNIDYHKNLTLVHTEHAVKNADIIIVLVDHKEFVNIKSERLLDFSGAK